MALFFSQDADWNNVREERLAEEAELARSRAIAEFGVVTVPMMVIPGPDDLLLLGLGGRLKQGSVAAKAIDGAEDAARLARRGGPYGHLDDHPSVNTGKPFTPSQKQKILAENKARNGGQILDDVTGQPLVRPQQHTRGVRPPDNEAHIDHVYPRSEGGPNTMSNAEVRARVDNLKKGNRIE